MALDSDNKNQGYLLGRLFAVLERLQEAAQPGINSTIRDRYFGSASTNPVTAFPILLKLKNHHLNKVKAKGWYETLLGEIFASIVSFPPHLSIAEQGMFSIGYYHQRQSFFEKKDKGE